MDGRASGDFRNQASDCRLAGEVSALSHLSWQSPRLSFHRQSSEVW